MSTETLTILQKRQAIERGLSQYLQGTLLEQVLNHWEAKYWWAMKTAGSICLWLKCRPASKTAP